jgi:hypothetical protein
VPVLRTASRLVLSATVLAALIAPRHGFSQEIAQQSTVPLPEIRVISTTPLPPPRRTPARRAAGAAAAAPAAPATPAPAEATSRVEPGAVESDKIPSNVQTLSAADFDSATSPDLLSALSRSFNPFADANGNIFVVPGDLGQKPVRPALLRLRHFL